MRGMPPGGECLMRFIRDDPEWPSRVVRDYAPLRKKAAETIAAMDDAVRRTERRESWFPLLRAVRTAHIQCRRTREMFRNRRREAGTERGGGGR